MAATTTGHLARKPIDDPPPKSGVEVRPVRSFDIRLGLLSFALFVSQFQYILGYSSLGVDILLIGVTYALTVFGDLRRSDLNYLGAVLFLSLTSSVALIWQEPAYDRQLIDHVLYQARFGSYLLAFLAALKLSQTIGTARVVRAVALAFSPACLAVILQISGLPFGYIYQFVYANGVDTYDSSIRLATFPGFLRARASGIYPFGNFAAHGMVLLFAAVWFLGRDARRELGATRLLTWAFFGAYLAVAICVLATGVRGALLLIAALPFLYILSRRGGAFTVRGLYFVFGIGLAVFAVSFGNLDFPSSTGDQNTLTNINSAVWRVNTWIDILVRAVQERSLFELAFGGGGNSSLRIEGVPPHNEYIRIFVEYGVLNGILLTSVLAATFTPASCQTGPHHFREFRAVVTSVIALGMIYENTLSYPPLTYFLLCIAGTAIGYRPDGRRLGRTAT